MEFINSLSGTSISGLSLASGTSPGSSLTKTATGQTNNNAIGLTVGDFDLAIALMTPTNALETALGVKYFALQGSIGEISFAGVPHLTVTAQRLAVQFNWSAPVFYGVPLFPVVDFAGTAAFASERIPLFDQNHDGTLTRGDLATLNHLNAANLTVLNSIALTDNAVADDEWLLTVLDTTNDGIIDLAEARQLFGTATDAADIVAAADKDNDGQIDPLGYEVSTGAEPIWFDMDSMLARAEGYIDLDVLGMVTFTGNFAFELGPVKQVDIVNTVALQGSAATRTVRTMTLGASSVYGFVGWNGPYFLDGNGDRILNRGPDGKPLPGEVRGAATGFALNNLSVGLFIGLDTSVTDPAGFVAMQFDLGSFESVGMPFLKLSAEMHVSMNVGLSLDSVSAVNFKSSFGSRGLFDLNGDGIVRVSEMRKLHGTASYGNLFSSNDPADRALEIADIYDALDTNTDEKLSKAEAVAFMAATWSDRPNEYDQDEDGMIDEGLAVNTGDPDRPVRLTFEKFVVSVELAGALTISAGGVNLAQLIGVFYLETDASEFKLFANAIVKLGPDIGAGSPSISLDALAVVVINGSGVAAEMRSATNLSGIGISYNSSSGIRLNSTEQDQTVVLPKRIVDFVTNSTSPLRNELLSRLHTEQLDLFDTDADGFVTVGELRLLSGNTQWGTLYNATDTSLRVIPISTIAAALDTNANGVLEVTEAAAFLSLGNSHLATDADRFANGVLTDTRYYVIHRAVDPESVVGEAYAVIEAHGDISLNGYQFAAADLRVSAEGSTFRAFIGISINLGPFGYVKAFGSLTASEDGVAGMLLADISLGKSSYGLEIGGTIVVQMNTSSVDATIDCYTINQQTGTVDTTLTQTTIEAGKTLVRLGGYFTFGGSFTLKGETTFIVDSSSSLDCEFQFATRMKLGNFGSFNVFGAARFADGVFSGCISLGVQQITHHSQ